MNANEARIKALAVNKEKDDISYKTVKDQINVKANEGKFELVWDDFEKIKITDNTINQLKKEGFACERFESGRNEYSWQINW
jgi:hypothetical protein